MICFSAFNNSVETVCLALAVACDLRCGFLRTVQFSQFPNACPWVTFWLTYIFSSIFVSYNVNVEVLTDWC